MLEWLGLNVGPSKDCSHLAPQQYYIFNEYWSSAGKYFKSISLIISSPGQQDVAIELAKPFTQPWDKEGSEGRHRFNAKKNLHCLINYFSSPEYGMGSCTVQKVKLSLARKIFSRLVKCGLYLIILHICSIQQNTTFEACLNSPVAGISIAGLQLSHCRILQVNNVVTFASMANVPATKS